MRESATERLIAAATRLFQERGLTRVGINEVIREADVARMSLYNNFQSKDDLALAAYTAVSQDRLETVDAAIEASDGPDAAILAVFDLAAEIADKSSFRGCSFINLAAHAGIEQALLLDLVRAHKQALRVRFERLARDLGDLEPEVTSRQLLALWDGALVDAFIQGDVAPIMAARAAASKITSRAT